MTSNEVNEMYGFMGLSASLDADDSPGAVWLQGLHDAISEAVEHDRFSGEDRGDVISELADSSVPVYTHNRWQTFVDICAYDYPDADEVGSVDELGATGWAGSVLDLMAERAMHAWLDAHVGEGEGNS